MQDRAFWDGEGDAWFNRNLESLLDPARVKNDPVLAIIQSTGLRARAVLEVGCANGWRLAELQERHGCNCCGTDPSAIAIGDGRQRYPSLALSRATAAALPFGRAQFDLVILSFCFHWIDRGALLRSTAEIDRVLQPGGYLLINDFAPRSPCKRAYQHCEGLWTYKQKYWQTFVASGLYLLRAVSRYDYQSGRAAANTLDENWADCALLQKEEVYLICG